MFDRCRKWRNSLDALEGGDLSPEDCAKLQSHLHHCNACASLHRVNALRRDVLRSHGGTNNLPDAGAFNDSVVAALRVPARPEALAPQRGLRALFRLLPTDFMQQMAGGMMAAAAVTIICLFSALHPKPMTSRQNAVPPPAAHNEPPVALEELLRAHSPRAASLWSSPTSAASRPPRPVPAAHHARPKDAGRRGSVSASGRLS